MENIGASDERVRHRTVVERAEAKPLGAKVVPALATGGAPAAHTPRGFRYDPGTRQHGVHSRRHACYHSDRLVAQCDRVLHRIALRPVPGVHIAAAHSDRTRCHHDLACRELANVSHLAQAHPLPARLDRAQSSHAGGIPTVAWPLSGRYQPSSLRPDVSGTGRTAELGAHQRTALAITRRTFGSWYTG